MKTIFASLLLGIATLAHAEFRDIPNIQVRGEAVQAIENDQALVTVTLTKEGAEKTATKEAVKTTLAQLTEWARNFPGLKEIQTDRITTEQVRNYQKPTGLSVVSGYRCSFTLTCLLTAESAGEFLAKAEEYPDAQISGPNFQPSREATAKVQKELLKLAFADAKEKAETLAAAANMDLGVALELSASYNQVIQQNQRNMEMLASDAGGAAPTPYQTESGKSQIHSTVSATFGMTKHTK